MCEQRGEEKGKRGKSSNPKPRRKRNRQKAREGEHRCSCARRGAYNSCDAARASARWANGGRKRVRTHCAVYRKENVGVVEVLAERVGEAFCGCSRNVSPLLMRTASARRHRAVRHSHDPAKRKTSRAIGLPIFAHASWNDKHCSASWRLACAASCWPHRRRVE